MIAEDMALLDEARDEWENMGFSDAWRDDGTEEGGDAPAGAQAGDAGSGDGGAGSDEAGQEWRDAEAAAEAARGEAGGDRGQIGPGWRRRVATLARWEPSAWANMCRALRKRPHGVMQEETEDVVGD